MNILHKILPLWFAQSPRKLVERQLVNAQLAYYYHAAQAERHEALRKMYEERVKRLEADLMPESYECHITVSVADAETATNVAKMGGWKTSEIARDPLLGEDTYFYLTCHAKEYTFILGKMKTCSAALESKGVKVIREKIERIVYDTKTAKVQ